MRALNPAVAVLVATVGTAFLPTPALGHEARGFISPSGVDFLADQLRYFVPEQLQPPTFTQTLFTCVGGRPVDATQQDTTVELEVHSADLEVTSPGTLRLDMRLSAEAHGQVFLKNPYVCFGSATCSDAAWVENARVVVDFEITTRDGAPHVEVELVDVLVDPDDVTFQLSDCAIDDILNWVVDFGKEWLIDLLLDKIGGVANEKLAPAIEEMVDGFTSFEGSVAVAEFSAALNDLQVADEGVQISADFDIFDPQPAAGCIRDDPGEPSSHGGAAPDLDRATTAHLGLAVDLGIVDDALYHVWRDGLTCLTEDHLAALGLDLDLDDKVTLVPGFPPGTEAHLEIYFAEPPRVVGHESDGADLTLVVENVNVDLTGERPDGTTASIHGEADATATARVTLDPSINSLVLEISGVTIDRLLLDDHVDASSLGFDIARLHQLVEERILPGLLHDFGRMPFVGSVFGYAGYYLILRDLYTTDAYVGIGADMFRAPDDDTHAPDTWITDVPSAVVNPAASAIRLQGSDAEVPPELVRYRVSVNGVAREPTFMRELKVGKRGESGTYRVEVSAVDLAGNQDPTPAVADVTVDGVEPHVAFLHSRQQLTDGRNLSVEWSAIDDLTPPGELSSTLSLYRLTDRTDWMATELITSTTLPPGVTAATVELEPGDSYRIVVTVRDLAGNESNTAFAYSMVGAGSGCDSSGRPGAGGPWLLFVLAAAVLLRRRSRSPAR